MVETNWTRGGHESVLGSASLLGRVSVQNEDLLIHRIRTSDAGNYSCKVVHRPTGNEDQIHYDLKILGEDFLLPIDFESFF